MASCASPYRDAGVATAARYIATKKVEGDVQQSKAEPEQPETEATPPAKLNYMPHAAAIGAEGINIEDFELEHLSPERGGTLSVLVTGEEAARRAADLLEAQGYSVIVSPPPPPPPPAALT